MTENDKSDVISENLVTFRSISELQEQNQRLLTVVRDLKEEQEKEEKVQSILSTLFIYTIITNILMYYEDLHQNDNTICVGLDSKQWRERNVEKRLRSSDETHRTDERGTRAPSHYHGVYCQPAQHVPRHAWPAGRGMWVSYTPLFLSDLKKWTMANTSSILIIFRANLCNDYALQRNIL